MRAPSTKLCAAIALAAGVLLTPAPGGAQRDAGSLAIERRSVEIVRRVVPFDGRTVREVGDQVNLVLDADVLFEFDSADLTPRATETLDAVAADLADRAMGTVTVVGHTDSIGSESYNQDLSLRRARAVEAFLAPRAGTEVTFSVEGRGEREPVAANTAPDGSDDPDGRSRNRRVELVYTVEAAPEPRG